MTDSKRSSELVRSLISEEKVLDPPELETVEPEIRSGIGILFRDALKRGVAPDVQDEIKLNLERGTLLDRFITEWGFDVQYENAESFHTWLLTNEKNLARACPQGVNYRGTYAVAAGERRLTGRYRTIWTFESFRAIQDLSERIGDSTSTLSRLLAEFNEFRDRDRAAPELEWVMLPAASAHRF